MAAERFVGQGRFHPGRQAIETRAHVGHTGCDLDARNRRQANHGRTLYKASWSSETSMLACRHTTASPTAVGRRLPFIRSTLPLIACLGAAVQLTLA